MPTSWKRPQLRAERAAVSMPASIVTMSAYQYSELADISRTGAKLKGDAMPPKGATALLRVKDLEILVRIVWVKGEECGIRFEETVSPAVLRQIQLNGSSVLEMVSGDSGEPVDDSYIQP
jgi:hypothetical protein